MKKLLLLACLFCLGASAQNLSTSGTISAASTANTCTATSCVYYQLPSGATWVTLQIAGTWSGSVGVYSITSQNATYQNLNSQTWTQQATLTANGTWAIAAGNSTFILVQSSSFSSGSANITMTASSTGSPLVNPILAGNLTVSGINQATASTSAQCWSTQGGVAACGYGPGTVIPISSGGTGATTAAQALTNLGALPLAGGTMTGALNLDVPLAVGNGGTGGNNQTSAFNNIVAPGGTITGTLNLQSGGLNFSHAGTTNLIAQSASGGFTATIPANTGTLAELNLSQTFTATQSFPSIDFNHAGTTEILPQSLSGGFIATLPANTGTIAETNIAQNWTGVQSYSNLQSSNLSGAETVTFAVDAAAGSGAAVSCYTSSRNECTNLNGMVQLTTGTSPTTGSLFTISWTTALSYSQNCVVSPGGGSSPETAAALQPGINNSLTTSFQVQANQTPLASTQYYFMYVCMN